MPVAVAGELMVPLLDKRLQPKSILVVDDSFDQRYVLASLLRLYGYNVYEAANASEALVLLRSPVVIHALITDVEMPGEHDGVELANHVRRTYPAIRVVVTSARDWSAGLSDRSVLFLQKPYRPQTLRAHLEQVLDHD